MFVDDVQQMRGSIIAADARADFTIGRKFSFHTHNESLAWRPETAKFEVLPKVMYNTATLIAGDTGSTAAGAALLITVLASAAVRHVVHQARDVQDGYEERLWIASFRASFKWMGRWMSLSVPGIRLLRRSGPVRSDPVR